MRCFGPITRMINAALLISALGGCGAPRSVDALMAQADRAIEREQRFLQADEQRARDRLDERRATLADAFAADLAAREAVDRDWYRQHAEAYATAREAVLEHALTRQAELAARRDNLEDAGQAQARALRLIQAHRQLFDPLERRADRVRQWMQESVDE